MVHREKRGLYFRAACFEVMNVGFYPCLLGSGASLEASSYSRVFFFCSRRPTPFGKPLIETARWAGTGPRESCVSLGSEPGVRRSVRRPTMPECAAGAALRVFEKVR
jgi:hypothetical protein